MAGGQVQNRYPLAGETRGDDLANTVQGTLPKFETHLLEAAVWSCGTMNHQQKHAHAALQRRTTSLRDVALRA